MAWVQAVDVRCDQPRVICRAVGHPAVVGDQVCVVLVLGAVAEVAAARHVVEVVHEPGVRGGHLPAEQSVDTEPACTYFVGVGVADVDRLRSICSAVVPDDDGGRWTRGKEQGTRGKGWVDI